MSEIEKAIQDLGFYKAKLYNGIFGDRIYVFDVAIKSLQEKLERESLKPLTTARFESICEAVHNGWWDEKRKQGVFDHPDMLPYHELSEDVKEYDRVTVRRVLDAIGISY